MSIDYRGPRAIAGNVGYQGVGFGHSGARRAREAIAANLRRGFVGRNAAAIRSEMVARAADAGRISAEILSDTIECWRFGWAISWICWNPKVMILGGGVAEMLRPHFGGIQARMKVGA